MTSSIYDINTKLLVESLLPIDKRQPVHIEWLVDLISPIERVNNNMMDYIYGSTYSSWTSSATYSIGNVVSGDISYAYQTFESVTDNNNNNQLTDSTNWIKWNDYRIGMNDRKHFRANKMVLEYALNDYYGTTFRQPNGVTSSTLSDIYIIDNIVRMPGFWVGQTPGFGYVFLNSSSGYVGSTVSHISQYQYTVYVPSALLSSLPSTASNVRNIVDKYNYTPLTYEVLSY